MTEQTSKNLLQVIERDIARNVEIIDLTLQAVVDNLKTPGVAETTPGLRQLILFDRASTAPDLGVRLVLDENGDSVIDASSVPPRNSTTPTTTIYRRTRPPPSWAFSLAGRWSRV